MAMKDLLGEIEQLPLDEQLALLEALSRHIRQTIEKRPKLDLRGILADDADPPSDETLKEDYINYLEEKYR